MSVDGSAPACAGRHLSAALGALGLWTMDLYLPVEVSGPERGFISGPCGQQLLLLPGCCSRAEMRGGVAGSSCLEHKANDKPARQRVWEKVSCGSSSEQHSALRLCSQQVLTAGILRSGRSQLQWGSWPLSWDLRCASQAQRSADSPHVTSPAVSRVQQGGGRLCGFGPPVRPCLERCMAGAPRSADRHC